MTAQCLKSKITTATGKLQPITISAILNLYQRGLRRITAEMVKKECGNLDSSVNWNNRCPAICNAMRNATECGGRIIGDNKDHYGFTISFDEDVSNSKFSNESLNIKTFKEKVATEQKLNNSTNMNNQISVNESFKNLRKKLDWDKIQDKSKNKLLIISCSGTKTPGGKDVQLNNYFSNSVFYKNLINDRNTRNVQYGNLIDNKPNDFLKKRIGLGAVNTVYFNNQMNNPLYLPAIERYAGGIFYTPQLIELYNQKNQESNLHILIVSGLYGIIEFRDSIIDYQLEINNVPLWTRHDNMNIFETVRKYMQENIISNDLVFYSLSPTNYINALKPKYEWNNLWITGSRSANTRYSAEFLKEEFLPRL